MKNPLDENSSRGFFALFRRKCPLMIDSCIRIFPVRL